MHKFSSLGAATALFFAWGPSLAAAPVPNVTPVEFGAVTLDISGAKPISRLISERKTIKKIQKSTAQGALKFRSGASGTYQILVRASGTEKDDHGAVETFISIQIPRKEGALDLSATGQRSWSVPAQVPEFWPERESPYEPIFRGPNAKRDKRDYRRKKSERDVQKSLSQKQARDNYRRQAIREAFADSLQDARDDAEKQLRIKLQPGVKPAP